MGSAPLEPSREGNCKTADEIGKIVSAARLQLREYVTFEVLLLIVSQQGLQEPERVASDQISPLHKSMR